MKAGQRQCRQLFPARKEQGGLPWKRTGIGSFALCALFACLLMLPACKDKKTELTLSTWGSSQEIAVLKQLIAKFETKHPGLHIKLLHIPDNYFQKLHLLIAGGMVPDVMFVNSINYPVYASHGVFKDLSSEVIKANFYPQSLSAFYWPKQSTKPFLGAIPRDISNLVVYYNRDWFRQKGIPEPAVNWTWVQLTEAGKALTEDQNKDGTPERFGISFYTKPPLFWLPFVWSANGQLLSQDLSQVKLNSSQALQGIQMVQDLRWKDHIAPRQIESGGTNMSQLFLQGKVAMLVSGRWSVPVFREQAKFDWDIVPLPVGPSGHSRVGIDASGYAVSATSLYSKEAVELAQFLTNRQSLQEVTRSGLIVPARKDVANSPIFLEAKQKPSHSRYFLSIIDTGVPTQTPTRWNEFSEELMLALQPVWDGNKTPKEAFDDETIKRLNHILQQEGR